MPAMMPGAAAAMKIEPQEDQFFRHVGNVFIKRMYFDFDQGHREAVTHAHDHDHITLLAWGALGVEIDGVVKEYMAPAFIDIKAGQHHKLIARIDKTLVFCVHDTHGLDVEDLGKPYVG